MAWLSWRCAAPTNISHGHVIQTLHYWLHSGRTAVKYSVDQTLPSMWKSAGSHDYWPHCKMALQHLTVLEINRWLDYTHIWSFDPIMYWRKWSDSTPSLVWPILAVNTVCMGVTITCWWCLKEFLKTIPGQITMLSGTMVCFSWWNFNAKRLNASSRCQGS